MEKYFSDVSRANVELLIVIPTGGVLLGTVISGLVSNLLGKKYTVIAGLSISLVFGIIPAFIFNYPAILISRAMFGVGMGIFTPLSVSYITDLFPEETRNRLLGWRNSVGAIGDSIMLFIAGFLINISWHTTYLVFLFLLVPILLVMFFVPKHYDNIVSEDGKEVEEDVKVKPTTNFGVIQLAFIFLLVCLFYSAISLKLASYVVNNHIGSAAAATRIFGFLVLCSIFSGLIFEKSLNGSASIRSPFLYHHCDFDDCHVLHHFHSGTVGTGAGGRLLQWHHQPGTNRANGALFAKRFYEFHDIHHHYWHQHRLSDRALFLPILR